MFSQARNFICTTILAPAFKRLAFRRRLPLLIINGTRHASNIPKRIVTCTTILAPPAHKGLLFQPRLTDLNMRVTRSSSAASVKDLEVIHDTRRKQFKIMLPDRKKAVMMYEIQGDTITISHTIVPVGHEGKGIGKKLSKAALEFIDQNNYQILPKCEYFRYYITKYEPKFLKNIQKYG